MALALAAKVWSQLGTVVQIIWAILAILALFIQAQIQRLVLVFINPFLLFLALQLIHS
jgi:hypothetical protein